MIKLKDILNKKNDKPIREILSRGGAIELFGHAKYLGQGIKDMTKAYKKKDWAQMEEEVDYIVTKAKLMGDIVKQKRYQESVNEAKIAHSKGGYVEVGKWYLLNYGKWKDTVKVVSIDAKGMKVYNPNDNWRYTIPMTMIKKKKIGGYMTPIEESVNESGLQYRMGVKRYGKEGMTKIQSAAGSGAGHAEIGKIKDKYDKKRKKQKKESVDESDLGLTYKKGKTVKVTHEKSGKELVIIDKPSVKKEYEKIGYFAEGKINEDFWAKPAGWSNQEARLHLDKDIRDMSKILGKASQQVIKVMMSGVKGDRYDALDIQRGLEYGPANRTHTGEGVFMKMLWRKVRDGFRRYSKDNKLRK